MRVRNTELAGESHVGLPDGSSVNLDAAGEADVNDTCGLFDVTGKALVRGWSLVDGKPRVVMADTGTFHIQDGPRVACIGPPGMANQQTSCPDGRTIAHFNADRVAVVPDTCRLNELPEYRFVSLEALGPALEQAKELEGEFLIEVPAEPEPAKNLEYIPPSKEERKAKIKEARGEAEPKKDKLRDTKELPLPHGQIGPGAANDRPVQEERPLVMDPEAPTPAQVAVATKAVVEAAAEPAGAIAPEVAAQLEGAAPIVGRWVCKHCGKNDFKSARSLTAHEQSHARSLPTAEIGGPVTPDPEPQKAAEASPAADAVTPADATPPVAATAEADANAAAVQAAMAQMD